MVRIFDSETCKELAALDGHTKAVTAVAFGSGGAVLATGSADMTVRVWERVRVDSPEGRPSGAGPTPNGAGGPAPAGE
jgi:WD40 repeat protein